MRTLVWFRGGDLRLGDHVPLMTALGKGEAVLAYVLDPQPLIGSNGNAAAHRVRFLFETLAALENQVRTRGSTLLIFVGDPRDVVPWFSEVCRADRVYAQRRTEPAARNEVKIISKRMGVPLKLFEGETLVPLGTIRTRTGEPYSVYGAFARAVAERMEPQRPLPRPRELPPLPRDVAQWLSVASHRRDRNVYLSVSELVARPPTSLRDAVRADVLAPESSYVGGEEAARNRLRNFLRFKARDYVTARDRIDLEGTSRISADLRFGSISPRMVWTAIQQSSIEPVSRDRFLAQLLWREFAHSTLWDRPTVLEQPFQSRFEGFPWRRDEATFAAWAEGRTGFPVVDAAARQLRTEGYVHNRARMIAASFLAKDLLLDFRLGERHYLDWLIDADPAQNDLGWQWSSGTGCDAQPYFRIFNPITQGTKFDPEGDYVRRYVPELSKLPGRYIHAPWLAPKPVLEAAGVRIGRDYPAPSVDHAGARNRFLAIAAEFFGKSTSRRASNAQVEMSFVEPHYQADMGPRS